MASLNMLQQQLNRTRDWLNDFTQNEGLFDQEFDVVDHDDTHSSDHGIESVSDADASRSSSFVHVASGTQSNEDGVSRSEHDSTYESSYDGSWRFRDRPPYWCSICDTLHCEWTFGLMDAERDDLEPMERKDNINYELCGRREDNTFKDLRSASKARKRRRADNEKYYFYKGVKRGWLNAPHYSSCQTKCVFGCFDCPPGDATVEIMTKKMLFEEAKLYPRPPTYHRSTKKSWLRGTPLRIERQMKEKKHARSQIQIEDRLDDEADDYWTEGDEIRLDRHGGDCDGAYDDELEVHLRELNWCFACDTSWRDCCGFSYFYKIADADAVDSLTFNTTADGKSWTLDWGNKWVDDWDSNRAPAVLPYTKQDWLGRKYEDCVSGYDQLVCYPFKDDL